YKDAGLLASRVYERPDDLQIYSRLPSATEPDKHWMFGSGEGMFLVPFGVNRDMLFPDPGSEQPAPVALAIFAGFQESDYAKDPEAEKAREAAAPTTLPWLIQNPDATAEQVKVDYGSRKKLRKTYPEVSLEILDLNMNTLVEPRYINEGQPLLLED